MNDETPLARWHEISMAQRTTVVAIAGHLDYVDAVALKHRLVDLAAAGARELIVDLSHADTVDRAVLPALVVALRRLGAHRAHLAVVSADPAVIAILETAGLQHLVRIAASLDDALDRPRLHVRG